MTENRFSVDVQGLEEVNRLLQRIAPAQFEQAKKEIRRSVFTVAKEVGNRIKNGSPLYSRTGQLRRSIKSDQTGSNLSSLSGFVSVGGATASYAPIHEQGGTIKAKKAYRSVPGGPYLNIPLPANKTASGVTRYSARDVFTGQGGFIVQSRRNNYIVMNDTGRAMFILKKQAKIPARLGLKNESEKEAQKLIQRLAPIPRL